MLCSAFHPNSPTSSRSPPRPPTPTPRRACRPKIAASASSIVQNQNTSPSPADARSSFGGFFHADVRERNTKLVLRVEGFDAESGKITDAAGRLALVSEDDVLAAALDFPALLNLWNRKHAQAVYVPAERRTEPELQYRCAPKVWLGSASDFTRFFARSRGAACISTLG